MTIEHRVGSEDGPTIVTFAQLESARDSKAVDKIEARFRDVLNDLKNTIDSLDALPRFVALESDREKLVLACIAAEREISHLRTLPMRNGPRFAEICDDLNARVASFRRRWSTTTDAELIGSST